jgi:uncharacterized membrane protein
MSRATKWVGFAATIASLVIVVMPAFFEIEYTQALTNLLVGEIIAIAVAHSTYRATAGKPPNPLSAVVAIVGGLVLAVSPILIDPVDPFLTIMLVLGLLIAVSGGIGLISRFRGGLDEQSGARRIGNKAGN